MDWIELSVKTNSQGADIVSEAMMRAGAKGTQIIDRADVPDPGKPSGYWELIDQKLIDDMPVDVIVKAWFQDEAKIARLRENLLQLPVLAGFDLGKMEIFTSEVLEKDWAEYWKRFYKPFRITTRLVVCPSWESYQAQKDDIVISLDPGLAFGTGTHETTALCAELIQKYFQGGKVLDIGTGSGILAIAAAKLGAKDVLAIDIDPLAVRTAQENVLINGLDAQVKVELGDLLQGLSETYDFAIANILADVIMMLSEPLKSQLKDDAIFICSGIIKDRQEDVRHALEKCGYDILETLCRGEWIAFAVKFCSGR
ncbi:MAG: 50S ribosomal protein L11 methyltransferase [Clostridiales bacterium]|nr:50S ribosomal protein L11 methyltransferase [Clostridiales bacterium]